jgi:UDP-N-acetylmuramate dehydrogenase
MSQPESLDELISEIKWCVERGINYRILGGGSNLLVSDKGIKGFVIKLDKSCSNMHLKGDNEVTVESGVSLGKFIAFLINNNLGGYELLASIPGTVGGAIFMNAGIGPEDNTQVSISDFLVSVKIYSNGKIITVPKKECGFGFRTSIFQKMDAVLLSAIFRLPKQDKSLGMKLRRKRLESVREQGFYDYPSAGSVFNKNYSRYASFLMKGLRFGRAGFAKWNGNWIYNYDKATSNQVKTLIRLAKITNSLFFKRASLEIEIWE